MMSQAEKGRAYCASFAKHKARLLDRLKPGLHTPETDFDVYNQAHEAARADIAMATRKSRWGSKSAQYSDARFAGRVSHPTKK